MMFVTDGNVWGWTSLTGTSTCKRVADGEFDWIVGISYVSNLCYVQLLKTGLFVLVNDEQLASGEIVISEVKDKINEVVSKYKDANTIELLRELISELVKLT